MGGIPSVQVGRSEIVDAVVLEHAVTLATGPTNDSRRRLDAEEIRGPQRSNVQIGPSAGARQDELRLSVVIGENGLVSGRAVRDVRERGLDVIEGEGSRGRAARREELLTQGRR